MVEKKRYAAIDVLRIVAAAAVVYFHYGYLMRDQAASLPLSTQVAASYGYLGVELFFMISGFVITLSAMGRTKSRFAYARFVRLWPAFIICMTLTIAVTGWPGIGTVIANSTMLPHILGMPYIDDVYWTLMFEIIFYAAIFLLLARDEKFVERLRLFAAAWLVAAAIGQLISLPKIKVLLVLDYAPFFCVGISLFLLEQTKRSIANVGLLSVSLAMAVVFAATQSLKIGAPHWPVHPSLWVCTGIVVLSALALFLSTQINLGPRGDKIAFALGGISYPLYLLHFSFGSALVRQFGEGIGLMAGAVTCYAVWRMELPLRSWLMNRTNSLPGFAERAAP